MTDQELDARFERFAADIKADIAGVKADVAGIKVVAEALRADIKVIADGHAAQTTCTRAPSRETRGAAGET